MELLWCYWPNFFYLTSQHLAAQWTNHFLCLLLLLALKASFLLLSILLDWVQGTWLDIYHHLLPLLFQSFTFYNPVKWQSWKLCTWNSFSKFREWECLTIDLTCISYFEIQKFVDKTQTKFPEFKLEIFSKKVSSIYVEIRNMVRLYSTCNFSLGWDQIF